jgi:shikimate dehydrogenase
VTQLKLGLIGTGIGKSRAPQLHRLAGRLVGIDVSYDLLQQEAQNPQAFDTALERCRSQGYRGVNVTYPFKERAASVVQVAADALRRLGAVNTIRFEPAGPQGFNTDYSGFKRAYAARFPGRKPGVTALVGAGGVGRAIAFGLVDLGAEAIRLFDQDRTKAEKLAAALGDGVYPRIVVCDALKEAVAGADGLLNATPIGMHLYPGTPIPTALIRGLSWAFDAVYTPIDTRFLQEAAAAGLEVLSGYELFFYQGVDAFEIFSGAKVDETRLREGLEQRLL